MKLIVVLFLFICAALNGQRSDFGTIGFQKADSIAKYYRGASLQNLPVLVHNLTTDLSTDMEKFRSIYTWVCTNIENDYGSYQKTVKKRRKLSDNPEALAQWNNNFTPKVFENLLKYKKTACTGYAYLISELAGLAGIQCKIIDGYGRTATMIPNKNSIPNHSWNAVELNGKWYLCDPTWSAGRIVLEDQGPRFEADYFDGYFLASPALFVKNHFPLEKDWTLLSDPPKFQNFLDGPVIYKEAFKENIMPTAPSQMQLEIVKNEGVSFNLSAPQLLDSESISLVLNGSNPIRPVITKTKEAYVLQHIFEKSGQYDVHIKIDDAIIVTYVVKVKRK